jgi:hypothetical protein
MVALFSIGGYAQGKTLGLKFGPNISWGGSGSATTHSDHARMGFAVGGFIDNYITQHVAISTGLNLNLMSMDYTFDDYRTAADFLEEAKVPVSRRFKGSYVELPLKLKVKIGILDSWSAYAEGGVGLSFNFSDKGKDSYKDPFGQHHQDATYQDYGYQYRMFQTALNFGLGVMYEITNNFNVFAQITVNNALSNTFNKTMQQQTGSIIRTNFVGLEIGICN